MNYNSACRTSFDMENMQTRDKQSQSQAQYQLFNPTENKKYDIVRQKALEQPNMLTSDGFCTQPSKIDDDTFLRNGAIQTSNGHKFTYIVNVYNFRST